MVAEGPRPVLDPLGQQLGQPMAAGIGRDEGVHQLGGEGLGLVVARRAHQLAGADDPPFEADREQLALRDQQQAAKIPLQRLPAGRADPAEPAAADDGGIRRLAQIGQVVLGEAAHALHGLARRHRRVHQGVQRRKLARMRRPTSWLFSTWNWVPARLPAATMATTSPP